MIPTVTFKEMIPNISEFMPIVYSKDCLPDWVKRARADFADKVRNGYPNKPVTSAHRCPGIMDLLKSGFIVRAWQDIAITTNGDGASFEWNVPVMTNDYTGEDAVGFHPPELLVDYLPKRTDTLKTILKLYAPWLCYVPKGYKLLSMPMVYSDDGRFTNCPGILDTSANSQLNLQIFWHVMNGMEVIKAGTPIAHFVLIPDDIAFDIEYVPYSAEVKQESFYQHYKHRARFIDR